MRSILIVCAAALLVQPVVAVSQPTIAQVDAGSRVRIAAPVFGPKKQIGTVVSLSRDTLGLRQGASTSFQSVAISDITALEVSNGTRTHKASGALWGVLLGAGSGAILGAALYKPRKCQDSVLLGCLELFGPDSRGTDAAFGAAVGALIGALAGTLVGTHATEVWVPGSVSAR